MPSGRRMLLQDIRYAVRWLRGNPGFTAAALLVLALGIGAATATFTVLHAVLLRPLPFHEPDRIIRVWSSASGRDLPFFSVSAADALDWRAGAATLSHVAPYERQEPFTIAGSGAPEQVVGARVSRDLFELFGVAPAMGRWFSADEDRPGGRARVAVIGHGFWQRRFGGRREAIGGTMRLDGEAWTIIGVMPPGFAIPNNPAEVWLPLQLEGDPASRDRRYLRVLARLRDGASAAEATRELEAIAAALARDYPASNGPWTVTVRPLFETVVDPNFRAALVAAAAAVALVLLMACANVAGLLLGRAAGRAREMAVRTALGASRAALVRQMLVESLVLASAGGVLGVLIAMWGLDALRALALVTIPRADAIEFRSEVLLFTVAATSLTALVFGLAPALAASRVRAGALHARTAAGSLRATRARDALVLAEVSLAIVLLAAAGLMMRSFVNLQQRALGFEPDGLLLLDVAPPQGSNAVAFYEALAGRLAALPGVETVGGGSRLPFAGPNSANTFALEGVLYDEGGRPDADYRVVTPAYFRALSMALVRGRSFTASDTADAPAAIVSASLARQYFGGSDPLGRRIRLGGGPWSVIVGIAADARYRGLDDPAGELRPMIYVPHTVRPETPMTIAVRSAVPPASLIPAVRALAAAIAPSQPIERLTTMEAILEEASGPHRFNTTVLGAFAWIALVLAASGLWGLIAHGVARRTHEIGVRVALGAAPRDIVRITAGRGFALAAAGVAVGLAAAAGTTRMLQSVLFGVSATDPSTFALIAAVFLAVAAGANLLPARRALRIDAAEALRSE